MSTPELSVVVTSYNRPQEVVISIEHLQRQSLGRDRFEVIVVDDGSTDRTPEVLRGLDLPAGFRVVYKENGGPASARNQGIEASRGEFVVLLQDDIFASERLLEHHLEAHRSRDRPVIVLGRTEWSSSMESTPFMDFLMEGDQFAFEWITDPEDVPYNFFYSSNVSFPREAVQEMGGFDEDFPYAAWEDTELGLRLTRGGLGMVFAPLALAEHHHPTTLGSFLDKRRRAGIASTILYRKAPECAPMMRYDKRPPEGVRKSMAPVYLLTRFVLQGAERSGWDRGIPVGVRRRLYRLMLDYEYFAGVAEGLRK